MTHKRRADLKETHGRANRRRGKTQLLKAQGAAARELQKSSDVGQLTLFGGQLPAQSAISQDAWTPRQLEVVTKFRTYRDKRRKEDGVDLDQRYRFDVVVEKGKFRFAKKNALSQVQKMRYAGYNPHADIEVHMSGVSVKLKHPFKKALSMFSGSLLVVKHLGIVYNLRTDVGLLDPAALAAILLGLRVATPEYINSIMAVSEDSLLKREIACLPPSVKFEALACRKEMHFVLTDTFAHSHGNLALILTSASKLVRSLWSVVTDEDAYDEAAIKKLKKQGKFMKLDSDDSRVSLHSFIRIHAVVNRVRSSSGKFKPLRR